MPGSLFILLTLSGVLLLFAGVWIFVSRGHFGLRALAFLLLTLGGLFLLVARAPAEHVPGFLLLAACGVTISAALALLAWFLLRRLRQLTNEADPDAGEGRDD